MAMIRAWLIGLAVGKDAKAKGKPDVGMEGVKSSAWDASEAAQESQATSGSGYCGNVRGMTQSDSFCKFLLLSQPYSEQLRVYACSTRLGSRLWSDKAYRFA